MSKRHKPDAIARHRRPGHERPAAGRGASTRVRALEADGALVVQGNTDIAVADFDYAAAFPWLDDVPEAQRAAAEWAHEQLSDDQLDYLRRLPAERRLWAGRLAGARLPRLAGQPDQRPAGRPRPVRDGRARHAHRRAGDRLRPHPCRRRARARPQADRQPRLVRLRLRRRAGGRAGRCSPSTTMPSRRPSCSGPPTTRRPVADEVSARGLPGDVYRAATIRTGRLVR